MTHYSYEPMVSITLTNDRMSVKVELVVSGKLTLQEAVGEILQLFEDDLICGEIADGPWKVTNGVDYIAFENHLLGASIHHNEIQAAIDRNN